MSGAISLEDTAIGQWMLSGHRRDETFVRADIIVRRITSTIRLRSFGYGPEIEAEQSIVVDTAALMRFLDTVGSEARAKAEALGISELGINAAARKKLEDAKE